MPDDTPPAVPDTVWGDIEARAARVMTWGRRMSAEIAELPDTLQRFREGAASFEVVGRRLEAATGSLEEITSIYQSTIADSTRRTADVASALRAQVDALGQTGSTERLTSTLADIQSSMESLARLNPLWPRRPTRPPDRS